MYKKQFVFTREQFQIDGYTTLGLRGGYLQYSPELKVYYSPRADVLLIGWAWQVDPTRNNPEREIEKLSSAYLQKIPREAIVDMEQTWCGRYVLIVQGSVYLDASGLLGVYYSEIGISSSCGLLASIMGLQNAIFKPEGNINFLPGPLTHYEGIKRLLPSQVYNIDNCTIEGRQLLPISLTQWTTDDEREEAFIKYFVYSLKSMVAFFDGYTLMIALTGGYDSRTLLTLARNAGIEYSTFTLEHDNMAVGDIKIPPMLSKAVSCNHYYGKRVKSDYSAELENQYVLHVDGLVADADKGYYAHKQYQKMLESINEKTVLLRGSVWESAVEYYRKFVSEPVNPAEVLDAFELRDTDLSGRSLLEYFDWCKSSPQNGLTDCNRVFWEIREGCWLSSIEQGFDLLDSAISLQPLNCRWLIGILLGFSRDDRVVKNHQTRIIEHLCPELKEVVFGNTLRDWGLLKITKQKCRKLLKLHGRLKTMGLLKTIQTYKKIIAVEKEAKNLRK